MRAQLPEFTDDGCLLLTGPIILPGLTLQLSTICLISRFFDQHRMYCRIAVEFAVDDGERELIRSICRQCRYSETQH